MSAWHQLQLPLHALHTPSSPSLVVAMSRSSGDIISTAAKCSDCYCFAGHFGHPGHDVLCHFLSLMQVS